MFKKLLLSSTLLACLFFMSSSQMSDNGKAARTGSPGETTCTGCHNDFVLNSGGGSISLQSPGTPTFQYTPGQTYTMSVTVSRSANSLFGVGIEALTTANDNAGTLNITNAASTQIKSATVGVVLRRNIVHTLNGGATAASKVFNFSWTAPATGTGNVTFYFAGVAADADGNEAGDYVYSGSQVFTETTCQPPVQPGAISGTNTLCNNTTVTYSVPVVSGATSYTWTFPSGWTGTSTSNSINATSGNTSGTISVTANSVCGSSPASTMPVTVRLISGTSQVTNVTCFGGNNGSATITPSGGTAPYTYSWAPSGGSLATATNLTVGVYTATITDANGCRSTTSVNVTQPSVISATTSTVANLCFGNSNGSATVTPTGGTSPYTYSWSPTGGNAATASNLSSGNYSVVVTDANGCRNTFSTSVNQPQQIISTASSTNITCFGSTNGTATVISSGGTGTLNYSWLPSGGTSSTAINLPLGNYTVTVTDVNGCTNTASTTITQPAAISANTTGTDATCGQSNGTATVSASGGTGNLTYLWNATPIQTTSTASNLSAGTYVVTVTDANACTQTASYSVNQPSSLTAAQSVSNVTCNGGTNGIAIATPSGGTPGYNFLWNTVPPQTNDTATNLAAGNYSVIITDLNGCSFSLAANVTEPGALIASAGTDVSLCNGDSTVLGGLPAASGGVSPYSYLWMPSTYLNANNIEAPVSIPQSDISYSLQVTDSNGCVANSTINIVVNPLPTPTITISNDTLVTPIAMSYQWLLNGSALSGATNVYYAPQANGDYSVLVMDQNGCSDTSATFNYSSVGIYSSMENNNLTVYPNPARNTVLVKAQELFRNGMLTIYTVKGEIIMTSSISDPIFSLDVSSLSKGNYILQIENGKFRTTSTLIISDK